MTTAATKPDTTTAGQPPEVDQPKHPLRALTTFELRGYRRQIENATLTSRELSASAANYRPRRSGDAWSL
jgi:hypothetical protein